MIKDSVENIGLYSGFSERLSQALGYLASVSADGFKEETVEIDGKDVYAMHQVYATEPEEGRLYENHNVYIDVQFVLEGTETIRVTDVSDLKPTTDYMPDTDATLYELGDGTDVKLGSGDFVVLYPQDAHVPKLMTGSPAEVKKIVVKVKM